MITPRYLYRNDFSALHDELAALPHKLRVFGAGEALWMPGEYIERVYYIERGIIKTALHDEDGTKKTIYFHGADSVFPGCHRSQFTIELSLVTTAVTPVTAMEFSIGQMQELLHRNPEFSQAMLESYARYINLLIFESAHQSHHRALMKLCNLLYLLARDTVPDGARLRHVSFSQEELAEILLLNRVSVARLLSQLREEDAIDTRRGAITITDEERLLEHCSLEVR
ncbi:Crp/Fnr family transcriptional regulator [Enorma phocaeensis]|uniref:Crp/Fnr family transcriptional regulator n=1 Tax=Enorma phocaeensis TaxID=1871019 RepID=A0A921IUG0_9ACTN|nr:Crp/Fnr family transcriptional regulator [Enorma phocaeensis]